MEQFTTITSSAPTLSGALTSSANTLTVSGGTGLPVSGTFRALIDAEILAVTSISGSTWTISRGQEGTTAASHSTGAAVNLIVTAAALNALPCIHSNGTEISNRRTLNFINGTVADNSGSNRCDITLPLTPYYSAVQPPAASAFTWVNQGSATSTTTSRGVLLSNLTPTGGHNLTALTVSTPTPPYTLTARLVNTWLGTAYQEIGLVLHDSVSGKLKSWAFCQDSGGLFLGQFDWNSPTSYSANNYYQYVINDDYFLRIADDSTNHIFSYSRDGEHFVVLFTQSNTAFLTADSIGFYTDPGSGSAAMSSHLISWLLGT